MANRTSRNNSQLSLDSSIGQFRSSNYRELCKLLNIHDFWKDLACVVQNRTNTAPRFSNDDVMTFERHSDPASQLLNTWSTDYVTIGQLVRILQSAGLLREVNFVLSLVQQPSPPVTQPGPTVSATAAADAGDDVIDKDSQQDSLEIGYLKLTEWTRGFSVTPDHSGGCLLGHGGYADVFKSVDVRSGRLVAVKRLKIEAISQASHKSQASHNPQQQFNNEINILSTCDHENVVKLIGYSTDGPCRCIVYEFMSNGSLDDRLGSSRSTGAGVLSVAQRVRIARDTVRGLAYLHTEKYIIHMDIKSANILLDERLRAKVGDYGISRTAPSSSETSTLTNVIIGTTIYMAPEYLATGRVSDKIDAYSFGMVLWSC